MDIDRLFKMSARQRSQTMRQVCRRLEEETNMTKIYILDSHSEMVSSLCLCLEM